MPALNDTAIKNIAIAGNIIFNIFSEIARMDLKGVMTITLNDRIDEMIRQQHGVPAFLNYRGFPKSSCISLNSEVVHGIPDARRMRDGDLVKIDVGVTYGGIIADAARTFPVGRIDPAAARLLRVCRQALRAGIKMARQGNRISAISRSIQTAVESNGYSVVRELTGHGVGQCLHEDPVIPNFVTRGADPAIQPGMALAIEPMINAGRHEVLTRGNGWTIATRDDSLSCHFEDTVVVLEKGNLNVTRVAEN